MIVLSGASASGKTEVAKVLASKYGIVKVITTTTRDKRIGEVDGKDYFFITKEDFKSKLKTGNFVEYTEYNGNYYGSSKDQVKLNKCVVIDPAGLKSYVALNNPSIVTFFLDCDEKTRYQRMLSRGDKLEDIERRIQSDKTLFDKKLVEDIVDYFVNSFDITIEALADKIYSLYKKEMDKRNIQL